MTRSQVLDAYFMEHRAKLLDIAAFLDRLERAQPDRSTQSDHRHPALLEAIALLTDGQAERARRVLDLLSDKSIEPIPEAHTKAASGAPPKS